MLRSKPSIGKKGSRADDGGSREGRNGSRDGAFEGGMGYTAEEDKRRKKLRYGVEE